MTTPAVVRPLKIIAIGNSRGVRLPQALLRRYGMAEQIILEELPDGLICFAAPVRAKHRLGKRFLRWRGSRRQALRTGAILMR